MKKTQRILIWDSSVCDLLNNRVFGGIAVQLYFWAQIFAEQGWKVYALTKHRSYTNNFIEFKFIRHFRGIDLIFEWFYIIFYILIIKPDVIMARGAKRHVLPLAVCGKLLGTKVVFFGASDVNFTPGKELCGNKINKKLYQKGIRLLKYIVTQNSYQTNTLNENYAKTSLQMYNIWGKTDGLKIEDFRQSKYDVVWIANFRKLKRPEWFVHLAEEITEASFAIAGCTRDNDYYENMRIRMEKTAKGSFLGAIPFYAANELVRQAKILVCTSEFEGFPNTFLQAWSSNVPVVSTVDPSGIIEKYNLGIVVSSEQGLHDAVRKLLYDTELYKTMQSCIQAYFTENHSAIVGFERLINYIKD